MPKQIKSPNLVSRRQSQKGPSTVKPNKTQSQNTNRVSKYRVSGERAEQLKRDFAPELIIIFPGLSGPIVKPLKTADEEGK